MDAVGVQAAALFGGDRGGDQAPRVGIVVEAVEMAGHPIRDRGAAGGGHLLQLGEIGDREDAWHDRYPDAGGVRAIAEAQEKIDIEEELSDRAAGARVELALQVVEVVLGTLRFRVNLGIGGDTDLEIGDALQSPDEIGGISVAAGIRRVMLDAARRITAQRNDVADPGLPVTMRHGIDLGSGRGNASEMGRRFERGLVPDAPRSEEHTSELQSLAYLVCRLLLEKKKDT